MYKEYIKKYRHAPAHLFLESHTYFITAGTYLKQHFFTSDQGKALLLEAIQQILWKSSADLIAWAILSNHYHLVMGLKDPFLLQEIIRKIHSKSSVEFNKKEKQAGRKIWQNYWDRCIRDEKDYYNKLNYVHYNPVKHGHTGDPTEYRFSSYGLYMKEFGSEMLERMVTKYPADHLYQQDDY